MRKQLLTFILVAASLLYTNTSIAQCDCGNGSDGAYVAGTSTTLAGGTYNYTSFTINSGVIVTVTGTQPLIIRCTGNVSIDGTLLLKGPDGTDGVTSVSAGMGGIAVAGGHNGADGIFSSSMGPLPGASGYGPGAGGLGTQWASGGGGGYATPGTTALGTGGGVGGPVYGNPILVGIDGGSGGGSGSGGFNCGSGGGGAGGGIVVIHACGTISISATGTINANGGNGGSDGTGNCGGGGGGTGGTVWLTSATVINNGTITAMPGTGGASSFSAPGGAGANGRIRLDYTVLNGIGAVMPPANTNNLFTLNSTATGTTCYGDINGATATVATGGAGVTYTYLWMPGAVTTAGMAGVAAGSYTVAVTDTNGCMAMDTVTVTQPAQLTVNTTSTPESTVSSNNGTATATAGGGTPPYTYLWMPGAGTTAAITGLDSGWYGVIVTDDSGCVATDTVHVGLTTSTASITIESTIHVYPNPATDAVHISIDKGMKQEVNIQLMDINGRALISEKMNGTNMSLNVSTYPTGNYILQIRTGGVIKNVPISLKR